jgi:hypothetical protein
MNYTGLTEERNEWRRQLLCGRLLDIHILKEYRLNKDSNLWRATREVEKLCEYILFLEGTKDMSVEVIVKCDYCSQDISKATLNTPYRIRLTEENRDLGSLIGFNTQPELSIPSLNFCDVNHLKQWLATK